MDGGALGGLLLILMLVFCFGWLIRNIIFSSIEEFNRDRGVTRRPPAPKQGVPRRVQRDEPGRSEAGVIPEDDREWQEEVAKPMTTEFATRAALEQGWITVEMLSESEKKKFLNPDGSIKRQEEE